MRCLTTDRVFNDYTYQSVIWSGDKLPVCPHCGVTPYDAEFYLRHEMFGNSEELEQKGGA